MKWYDAKKKKPYPGKIVLVCPRKPMPLAYWDNKKEKWISGLYPLPAFPYTINNVEKWAYIDYPKRSLWQRILKKLKSLNFRSKG